MKKYIGIKKNKMNNLVTENQHCVVKDNKQKSYMTIKHALIFYILITFLVIIMSYYFIKLNIYSSFILGLIVGQVMLNVTYLPVYVDYWSELDSYICLYTFIQIITPIIIFIYVLIKIFSDKRK